MTGLARDVKGQQFHTAILLGVGNDDLPDLRGIEGEARREQRTEEDFRVFVVAVSRAERVLHMLWTGPEPSAFVTHLGAVRTG